MTANSIAYANYLETVRHNGVMELLERKKRDIEADAARIQERKNLSEAQYNFKSLEETRRHNAETETLTRYNDMARNYINYLAHRESVRHNTENERIATEGNSISWMNAETNRQNAETNAGQLAEFERSNRKSEELTERGQNFGLNASYITAGATEYAASTNYAGTVYSADAHLAGQKFNGYVDIITTGMQNESREKIQRVISRTQTLTTRMTSNTQRYLGTLNRKTELQKAELGLEGTIYSADKHYLGTRFAAKQSSRASRYAANKAYKASKHTAETSRKNTTQSNLVKFGTTALQGISNLAGAAAQSMFGGKK